MSILYIGKVVHYHSYGTPNGEYTPQPRAAIVTEILPENRASLCVLNPTGIHLNQNLPFAETPTPGHWNYIPDVADDTISTSTLDTTSFPDEDAEYNEPTEQAVPTTPDFTETEICGKVKYGAPNNSNESVNEYCIKPRSHEGDHESWSGVTWPNY